MGNRIDVWVGEHAMGMLCGGRLFVWVKGGSLICAREGNILRGRAWLDKVVAQQASIQASRQASVYGYSSWLRQGEEGR